MGSQYIGELRLVSFNFAPSGWAQANGQVMAINQNQPLFALFGTMYGGDGRATFALPNLQGRVAMHFGNGFGQGQASGEVNHTLLISEIPQHTHVPNAVNGSANNSSPVGHFFANTGAGLSIYSNANATAVSPAVVSNTGGSQGHPNQQPFLVMNWIVSLSGIFPSRS
jgi:microcystin-dependent protein